MITFADLCEDLKKLEETLLVDLLQLHSDEIVERFKDIIEERYDYLETLFREGTEDNE